MLLISRIASSRLILIASISRRARIFRRRRASQGIAVKAQRGERDELGRAIVQVGADPAQIALVEGGDALRGALDPQPQLPVLREQSRTIR